MFIVKQTRYLITIDGKNKYLLLDMWALDRRFYGREQKKAGGDFPTR
jgi:hypothetical protein